MKKCKRGGKKDERKNEKPYKRWDCTHTHTHTLGYIKEGKEKIWNKGQSILSKPDGITLVALVVTVVVLLILAGITLIYVLGDNSVFKQATDAKLQTELATIEERAGLIYADKLMEKVSTDFNNKPTMQEIVAELGEEGYTIKQVEVSGSEITGISLDKETMSIGKDKTGTIKVTLESKNEPYNYYVLVDGEYYKMSFNGSGVTIDRTPSGITEGEEGEKITLTATSENEEMATVVVNNDTNTVEVTAKGTAGLVEIRVTYGNFSKTCIVKVCEVASEVEISSVRARIAKDYTRGLSAVAKPEETASQVTTLNSDFSITGTGNIGSTKIDYSNFFFNGIPDGKYSLARANIFDAIIDFLQNILYLKRKVPLSF